VLERLAAVAEPLDAQERSCTIGLDTAGPPDAEAIVAAWRRLGGPAAAARPGAADSGTPSPREGDALLLVDVQRDFLPGGALAVPGGERVLAPLARGVAAFVARALPVFASRDWHPADHCSFAAAGGPWPPHCIAGTDGAAFAPGLALPPDAVIVSKATTRERDAYSAFAGTGLAELLRARGIRRLFVGGLATDYCVRQTVLDARALDLEVCLLGDAVAAVDVQPGDGERALGAMRAAGASVVASGALSA
jgi:nicotinamidase/pyrazinamidase